MAAPSYTEDLTDIDLANSTTGWAESSATQWKDGGSATTDTDYPYIQGSVAITQQATKSTYCSLLYNNGTGITLPTDGAYFVWQVFSSPTVLQNKATGGMMVLVGSGLGDFYAWNVGGSDTGRNPYGGWQNWAVNTGESAYTTVGTPGTTEQYIGAACNLTAGIGKGNPHGVDAIRYGRGSSIFKNGDVTNGYCTFAGYAAVNDGTSTRWGLIQAIDGGYLWKGKMTFGDATTSCDFRDSNANILIADTDKCTANFNTIEINNASTRVDWDNVKFTALGTQSPGRLVTNANADLNWDACQFTDMGEFEFGGTNSTCTNAIWNGCGQINNTGVRVDLSGSQIVDSTVVADEGALYWNVSTSAETYTDGITFEQGTAAHHAIRFGTSVTSSFTLRDLNLNGFGSGADTNGSTFRFDATTGSLTLSLVNCFVDGSSATSGNIGIDDAAGISVTVSIDPVTFTVNIKDNEGNNESGVYVWVAASSAAGDLPFEQSITSISQAVGSPFTRTVTFAANHGMKDNDYLKLYGIENATEDNNGAFQVTVSSPTVVTYTGADTGETSFTGTITGTGGVLYGTTDASGNISASRTWGANQPYTGQARKSTTSPRFKTIELAGTISSSADTNVNRRLVLDE